MASKENDFSLLEIANNLLGKKKKPQLLNDIIKDVMSSKGYKAKQAKEEAPQFILDFQSCGYFIYCGDGKWDLKDRQPTSILDKDGGDYEDILEDDEDVIKNELKDDDYIQVHEDEELVNDHLVEHTEEEEEEEEEDDSDDLSAEFETGDDETDELTDDNDDLAYADDDDVDEEVDGDLVVEDADAEETEEEDDENI